MYYVRRGKVRGDRLTNRLLALFEVQDLWQPLPHMQSLLVQGRLEGRAPSCPGLP